jgi:hypothetical protein
MHQVWSRALQMSCHLDPFEYLRVNPGRDLITVLNDKISHDLRNDTLIKVILRHDAGGFCITSAPCGTPPHIFVRPMTAGIWRSDPVRL